MLTSTVPYPLTIAGTGVALPRQWVSSVQLEQQQQWPAGWCLRHTGVAGRYWAQPGEHISTLGAAALRQALAAANMLYEQLDLVICGSATYDYPVPHNSCLIQQQMGSSKPIPGWDIDATCLGFITCLDVASRLLDGTRYRNIAIVCSEICSTSLNPADAETYALMGDGAAAIIVSHCPNSQKGVLAAHMQTWPQQALLTQVPAGGHVQHGLTQPPRQDYFFRMEGTSLLKTALRHLKPFTQQLLQMAGLQLHQLSLIVPHQASLNGMQGYAKLMHIDPQILFTNIQQYGNTLSASVGIALHEALQTQKAVPGQTIMLIGTGAGFSIGGLVLQL